MSNHINRVQCSNFNLKFRTFMEGEGRRAPEIAGFVEEARFPEEPIFCNFLK